MLKRKLILQNQNFKKNKEKLDLVRRNNIMLKLLICKIISK
jgi:hypothetical protein